MMAMDKTKILFVCMGNICRSPTAHGVMQQKVSARGLADYYEIESAGTHAYHVGEMSDSRSRSKAAEKGVDMNYIRAQKMTAHDFNVYNYILAMDSDNLSLIEQMAPEKHSAEVTLFLRYAVQSGLTERRTVPDPYYGGTDGFEDVFQLIDLGCNALIEHTEQTRLG